MNMNGWHVKGLFAIENTLSIYLSIVLKTVLGDSSFKIIFKIFNILLIWDKNVELHTSWLVAKLLQIRPWVYFLLTLNMGMADGILYCLNLNLSMHFRVGSRGLVTFKTKLYVTTFNNSFLLLPVFCQKEVHLRCYIRLELNIVTIHKNPKKYQGTLPPIQCNRGKIFKKHTLQDALKIHFQRFFTLH